jgi:hypothetical protein
MAPAHMGCVGMPACKQPARLGLHSDEAGRPAACNNESDGKMFRASLTNPNKVMAL